MFSLQFRSFKAVFRCSCRLVKQFFRQSNIRQVFQMSDFQFVQAIVGAIQKGQSGEPLGIQPGEAIARDLQLGQCSG